MGVKITPIFYNTLNYLLSALSWVSYVRSKRTRSALSDFNLIPSPDTVKPKLSRQSPYRHVFSNQYDHSLCKTEGNKDPHGLIHRDPPKGSVSENSRIEGFWA